MDEGGSREHTNDWVENPGRNRWRFKKDSDKKIIEIKLTQNKITQIDAHRYIEVKDYCWYSVTSEEQNTWYAEAKFKIRRGKWENRRMHIHLFPRYCPPRDHKDNDGLNNLGSNIRSGAHGINNRNIRSKKRHIGVTKLPNGKKFKAVWKEKDRKDVTKYFSCEEYGGEENAFQAAALCRKTNNDRVIEELSALGDTDVGSGFKNITVHADRMDAVITVNKKKIKKSFYISEYDFFEGMTLKAAQEWVEEKKRKRGE